MGGAVQPDAQVALGAEELEEIGRLGLGRDRHAEGDEDGGRLAIFLFGRFDGSEDLGGDGTGGLDADFAAAIRAGAFARRGIRILR
jgi:hypothetical protein